MCTWISIPTPEFRNSYLHLLVGKIGLLVQGLTHNYCFIQAKLIIFENLQINKPLGEAVSS